MQILRLLKTVAYAEQVEVVEGNRLHTVGSIVHVGGVAADTHCRVHCTGTGTLLYGSQLHTVWAIFPSKNRSI
jgi:hypothetical protein